MNAAPRSEPMGFNEKGRRNGPALSASRRKAPMPIHSRLGAQPSKGPTRSGLFPPLNETSFSEQYKTFKAHGGNSKKIPMANNL